ncbi:MAG: hypothetical protein ABI306_01940 [Caulobacteraceae bacterium]
MTSDPTNSAQNAPPIEFPQATPRELYSTSDIRFVMLELGKLTSQVGRLIEDVRGHGEKVDALRHQVTFVRGALWVIAGVVAFLGVAAMWYFSGKLSITLKPGA